MDYRLLDFAKEAEDAASGLHVFKDEIPRYAKDITGDIAELFAISNALHVLHEGLALSHYGRYSSRILADFDVVLPSLGYTLEDVSQLFTKSQRKNRQHPGAFPGTPPYDLIWEEAMDEFENQSIGLPVRLEYYRMYLQGLFDILKGDDYDEEIERLRPRLKRLLKEQQSYFDRLPISAPGRSRTPRPMSPRPLSPQTPRPTMAPRYQTYPNYVPSPSSPYQHPPPLPPRSPMYGMHVPPPAPEIPHSPTISTVSSQNMSTHSDGSSNGGGHWATKIFDGRYSSTPFKILGQSTKCLGRDEPQSLEFLEEDGFQKVLELSFEASNVWVRLYWRATDQRARILFLTLDSEGRRMRYCFPLTGLKFLRTESCLQLCRVNRQDGKLDLWANLRFTLYERMVLFYCTAVAMKRQDRFAIAPGMEDFFQPGEKEEFGGEIQDDNYLHAFRIFRDRDSHCVRFETTARRGAMKTIPIWTAFVTQFIGQRSWMKRVGSTTVQLRELHPYIFCDGYSPPRGASGRYQLTFTSSADARDFVETFHRIKTR